MGWTELILALSVLLNWYQYGEVEKADLERDIAIKQANACAEAREDARDINKREAEQRESVESDVARVVSGQRLDARRSFEVGANSPSSVACLGSPSSAGAARMEAIRATTDRINKAVRPATTPVDQKGTTDG